MIPWDDCQTVVKTMGSDSTSTSLTFFKLMMNVGYKQILADLGKPIIEKTQTSTLVANQQNYQFPPDYLFLKSVTVTQSSIAYPIQEEESQEIWDLLNAKSTQTAAVPELYFLRPSFGVSGGEILFSPTPSTANTYTIIYEATDKDLGTDKYTTGSIAVTNGSATVTGTSTTFTAAMVGRYLKLDSGDGLWYKVSSYTSATVITLENVYEGATATGAAYQIAEIFSLPEEMQILPCYFSLWHYFAIKKDVTQETKYMALFTNGLEQGKKRHSTKSRSAIVRSKKWASRWSMAVPGHFPTEISS